MRHDLRAGTVTVEPKRVLFLAQPPPPFHGQAVVAETVHGILSDELGCAVTRRWGGGAASNEDVGKRSLGKYLGFAGLLARLAGGALGGKRHDVAYLGLVPWAHTVLRDGLLAGMAKLQARRVWVHVHGDGLASLLSGRGLKSRLARRLLSGTELIAATSDTAQAAEASGIFSRVVYLPNLAPDPGAPRRFERDELVVSCLGNLDPRKGVLDFVEVIKAATDKGMRVRASIIGGATAALGVEELRRRVADRGLADVITVTGRVEDKPKSDILADSDVFLYLSRHDLAPLSLIEGMAHGCAPLLLDIGGLREMVGEGLAHNVLDPARQGQELTAACLQRLEQYRQDRSSLDADRNAARARFLDAYSPEAFRLRVKALLAGR